MGACERDIVKALCHVLALASAEAEEVGARTCGMSTVQAYANVFNLARV
jgi:hypothetical protein